MKQTIFQWFLGLVPIYFSVSATWPFGEKLNILCFLWLRIYVSCSTMASTRRRPRFHTLRLCLPAAPHCAHADGVSYRLHRILRIRTFSTYLALRTWTEVFIFCCLLTCFASFLWKSGKFCLRKLPKTNGPWFYVFGLWFYVFGPWFFDLTLILRIPTFDPYVTGPLDPLIYVFGQFFYVFGLIKVLRSAYWNVVLRIWTWFCTLGLDSMYLNLIVCMWKEPPNKQQNALKHLL